MKIRHETKNPRTEVAFRNFEDIGSREKRHIYRVARQANTLVSDSDESVVEKGKKRSAVFRGLGGTVVTVDVAVDPIQTISTRVEVSGGDYWDTITSPPCVRAERSKVVAGGESEVIGTYDIDRVENVLPIQEVAQTLRIAQRMQK